MSKFCLVSLIFFSVVFHSNLGSQLKSPLWKILALPTRKTPLLRLEPITFDKDIIHVYMQINFPMLEEKQKVYISILGETSWCLSCSFPGLWCARFCLCCFLFARAWENTAEKLRLSLVWSSHAPN